jgi:hypothetical protein
MVAREQILECSIESSVRVRVLSSSVLGAVEGASGSWE